jgi:hypothetical protein
MKISELKWFVGLWLAGFLSLAVIAGLFRLLLQLAY